MVCQLDGDEGETDPQQGERNDRRVTENDGLGRHVPDSVAEAGTDAEDDTAPAPGGNETAGEQAEEDQGNQQCDELR